MNVKYPDIKVTLLGTNGNAFAVLGKVKKALRRGGVKDDEIKLFFDEATSGNYDNVLATAMRWVEVN